MSHTSSSRGSEGGRECPQILLSILLRRAKQWRSHIGKMPAVFRCCLKIKQHVTRAISNATAATRITTLGCAPTEEPPTAIVLILSRKESSENRRFTLPPSDRRLQFYSEARNRPCHLLQLLPRLAVLPTIEPQCSRHMKQVINSTHRKTPTIFHLQSFPECVEV